MIYKRNMMSNNQLYNVIRLKSDYKFMEKCSEQDNQKLTKLNNQKEKEIMNLTEKIHR